MSARRVKVVVLAGAVLYAEGEDGERRGHVEGQSLELPPTEAKALEEQGLVERA